MHQSRNYKQEMCPFFPFIFLNTEPRKYLASSTTAPSSLIFAQTSATAFRYLSSSKTLPSYIAYTLLKLIVVFLIFFALDRRASLYLLFYFSCLSLSLLDLTYNLIFLFDVGVLRNQVISIVVGLCTDFLFSFFDVQVFRSNSNAKSDLSGSFDFDAGLTAFFCISYL